MFSREGPCDPKHDPRSSEPVHPLSQTVRGRHEGNVGVLVAQDDVDEALNKVTNDQQEAEAALERYSQAERTASGIRQSNREFIKGRETYDARF